MSEQGPGAPGTEQLELSQLFEAPRETVFAAYTDPDQVTQWWAPHGFEAPREKIEIEPRVGGKFNVMMVLVSEEIAAGMGVPVGTEFPDHSTITEFDPPRLIVIDSQAVPEAGLSFDSQSRIEFVEEAEGRTRINVTSGPYTPEMAPNAKLGWQQQLEKLAALLAG